MALDSAGYRSSERFENRTVRVNPDRQTLILAGETPPRRLNVFPSSNAVVADRSLVADRTGYASQRVLITPVDAGITEAEFSDTVTYAAIPSAQPSASMGSAFSGASAYARTQALSDRYPFIIDTYA